jgi:hypothetical protein
MNVQDIYIQKRIFIKFFIKFDLSLSHFQLNINNHC